MPSYDPAQAQAYQQWQQGQPAEAQPYLGHQQAARQDGWTQAQQPAPAPAVPQGVSFLVFGPKGAGKSQLGDTVPGPRLVLDCEGGSRWTPSRKKLWDPSMSAPPWPDGTWDTAWVNVHDFRQVAAAYKWLNSGQHPFNGLVLDSVSEIQQRVMDTLAGTSQMEMKHWGKLLRDVSSMARQFRDLISHPVKPLWGVCMIAMTHEYKNTGRQRPLLQGAIQDYLPYYVDVCGYLWSDPDETRHLMIGPHPQYETGNRVGGRLPYTITGRDSEPSISTMISQVIAQ